MRSGDPSATLAAAAISVAGGQIATSLAMPAIPVFTASISARLATVPFIFQLPATSGLRRAMQGNSLLDWRPMIAEKAGTARLRTVETAPQGLGQAFQGPLLSG